MNMNCPKVDLKVPQRNGRFVGSTYSLQWHSVRVHQFAELIGLLHHLLQRFIMSVGLGM